MAGKYNGAIAKVAGIEKLIVEILGVEASYVEDYDRLQIRGDDRVQSRIDKNNAPKFMVERYTHQMGESTFPPIIVTADHIKVDGNTRDKAYAARGTRYIDALVIPIHWDSADIETRRRLEFLSERINNMNGLPLDLEEREKMVATMIAQGAPDEEIVSQVGLPLNKIIALRDRYKAAVRLERLGFESDSIPDGLLRTFGSGGTMKLDDDAYKGVIGIVQDAGIDKTNDVKALAASLNEIGTSEGRRERLARERVAREPEIAARASGQVVTALAGQLRGRLKFIVNNPAAAFVERNPEKIEEHVALIESAQQVLTQILALQVAATGSASARPETRPHH
jgi:hypothetical protein